VNRERETPSQDPPRNLPDIEFENLLEWFSGVILGANQDAAERAIVDGDCT
jgi:hypothetical protein